MKKLIIIIMLSTFSMICMSQDFVFDKKTQRMNVPIVKNGTQWEIGSSCVRIILQDDNQITDTIFTSIGCSQYQLEITEEYADLKIFLWPLNFFYTDCALEDDVRPEKKDCDLLIHYVFRNNSITAEVRWNTEKYFNANNYSSIAFDSFDNDYLTSVFSLIQHGKTINEIIDSLSLDNQKRQSNADDYMYRNDVLISLLPLNNKTFSTSDIYILTNSFDSIHKKYTR